MADLSDLSDRNAFLAAIVAEPGDITARLIYADWLEDQGGEEDRLRGELIRVQHEIWQIDSQWHGKTSREAETDEFREVERRKILLKRRQSEILETRFMHPDWAAVTTAAYYSWARLNPVWFQAGGGQGYLHIDADNPKPWEFRSGFVEALTCTWEQWVRHCDAIRELAPIREITLTSPAVLEIFEAQGIGHIPNSLHAIIPGWPSSRSVIVPEIDLSRPRFDQALEAVFQVLWPGIGFVRRWAQGVDHPPSTPYAAAIGGTQWRPGQ